MAMYTYEVKKDGQPFHSGEGDMLVICGAKGEIGIEYMVAGSYHHIKSHNLLFHDFRLIALLQSASLEIGQEIRKIVPDMPEEAFGQAVELAMSMVEKQFKMSKMIKETKLEGLTHDKSKD